MSDWFNKKALDVAPALPGAQMKSLDDMQNERAALPPPTPNPTGIPEPIEPMSLKALAQLFEMAAKSLLDSKLNIEKACVALSKVAAMKSQTDKDREIATKANGFAEEAREYMGRIEAQAKNISSMRDGLSESKNPWLE